jgi:hypothetical protein
VCVNFATPSQSSFRNLPRLTGCRTERGEESCDFSVGEHACVPSTSLPLPLTVTTGDAISISGDILSSVRRWWGGAKSDAPEPSLSSPHVRDACTEERCGKEGIRIGGVVSKAFDGACK